MEVGELAGEKRLNPKTLCPSGCVVRRGSPFTCIAEVYAVEHLSPILRLELHYGGFLKTLFLGLKFRL